MSLDNALIYVENIRKALRKHDPANAATYAANAAAYSGQDQGARRADPRRRIAAIPEEQRWLVDQRRRLQLSGARLRPEGALSLADQCRPAGHAAAGAPGDRHRAREQGPGGVLRKHDVRPQPAKQVARETGAGYGGVLYVDSLSDADGPVPTYLDLLKVTRETIADGLTGAAMR